MVFFGLCFVVVVRFLFVVFVWGGFVLCVCDVVFSSVAFFCRVGCDLFCGVVVVFDVSFCVVWFFLWWLLWLVLRE